MRLLGAATRYPVHVVWWGRVASGTRRLTLRGGGSSDEPRDGVLFALRPVAFAGARLPGDGGFGMMTPAEWAQSPRGQEELRRAAVEASNSIRRLQDARRLPV